LAPGTSAVWPTSRTRRNAPRLQAVSALLLGGAFSSPVARTPCHASAATTSATVPIRFITASLARLAALDEGGADERDGQIAALVRSGVAAEHEPPLGPTFGRARFHHLGCKRNRVAGIDRLEPLEIAEPGRGAEFGNRLAAGSARLVLGAPGGHRGGPPHPDGVPAPGHQPAGRRLRRGRFVEMKRLRIEAGRE